MSMTENEAINELQANIDLPFGFTVSDEVSAMAIQALEEIQQYRELGTVEEILKVFNNQRTIIATQHETVKQYRAIGTIEEFKALKEKNEPKKVIKKLDAKTQIVYYRCPNCNVIAGTNITELHSNNCSCCGQSLKGY